VTSDWVTAAFVLLVAVAIPFCLFMSWLETRRQRSTRTAAAAFRHPTAGTRTVSHASSSVRAFGSRPNHTPAEVPAVLRKETRP
jgi:hypothetical protein